MVKKGPRKTTDQQPTEKRPLSASYEDNLQALRQVFDLCADILFREFIINTEHTIRAFVVYVAGLTDYEMISDHLLKTVMQETVTLPSSVHITRSNILKIINERLINLAETNTTSDLIELVKKVLEGNTALVLDGSTTAIIAGVRGGESRAVSEPDTEPGVRGPKDGFVESIDTNLSLIRRRLKTSRLKTERFHVGLLTKTKLAVCYIEGIANDKIVQEVKQRIGRINVDSILSGNHIEELIMDERISLFPLVQYTERPDKATASLLEGRIIILVDNSPMPLIVPVTFISLLQAAEDYYNNTVFGTMTRLLRFFALNIAMLLPAMTVAAFSFHLELLPTSLINTVAGARQGLPLPIVFEILFIEFAFELLREAGVRLPKTIGQAISTVGGLVIGQSAVTAGLVSPISVIVVAITAIASFTIPNYAAGTAIRILRFVLIILAGILGGVGIILGLMVILTYLCGLRSFGIPYLLPLAPLSLRDLKDSMVRMPLWAMQKRPQLFSAGNLDRQDPDQGPQKPDQGGQGS
ncbi:spore germination protein, GerA family [Desulfosporosinus orientis DSM 765]|uniref:Spore germination protein, GerA family n=1 Tax=Desulfosporosinus orientis (strain ATCC 19365 / DSM 765 / NCIMB 8382 / VKM B-1628 / Singapore I) TaxID=768706 RepID=G7W5F2_DESOD|nr:spore germination protein [Desulfosporosinus orientis]AET66380.1 spore germination protein, GerA family [Desulfosporosinus orientis DSM 765]